jgi:hypothetical protein
VTLSPTELEVRRRTGNPLWPWTWVVRYRDGSWHQAVRDGVAQHEADIRAPDLAWLELRAPGQAPVRLTVPPEGVRAVRLRAQVTLGLDEAATPSVVRRVALLHADGLWRGWAIDDAGRVEAIARRWPWP